MTAIVIKLAFELSLAVPLSKVLAFAVVRQFLFLVYCFFDQVVKLFVLHSIQFRWNNTTGLYCIILMNKQIQLSSNSPSKRSFLGCRTDKKSKFSNSTMYSVLTGKRIKTDVEIHDNIKVKRAQSYKKLSFSLRKNDLLLKSHKKVDNCESRDHAINQILPLKSRNQLSTEKFRLTPHRVTTENLELSSKFSMKRNIINQEDLVSDILIRKSESPVRTAINQRGKRLKTEHQEEKYTNFIESQVLLRQNTENLDVKKKKPHLITTLVSSELQESLFTKKQKIPGINFKAQTSSAKKHFKQSTRNKSTLCGSTVINGSKKLTYLHQNELLQFDDEDRRISELYDIRLEKNLTDLPKQWHFYNCLRMNQLSLYRTNLKLSCQSWILIDHLQLKYLRGWHPKQIMQFDIGKRLFLTLMALEMKVQYKIELKNVIMRLNNNSLRRKMQSPSNILLDSQFSLRNNTILSLEDLLIGVLVTKKQDLFWHLAYGICSLYRKFNLQAQVPSQQIESSQIYIQDQLQYIKSLDLILIQKCRQICERRNLTQTKLQIKLKKHVIVKNDKLLHGLKYDYSVFKQGNEFEYLQINSSCVDMSILFMDCLGYPFFEQLMKPQPLISCIIKLQMGYKFWQTRQHKWKNEYSMYLNKGFGVLQGRNEETKTLSIISYNSIDKVIIICNDCKLNMCLRDISGIQSWMHETFKRFKKPVSTNEIIRIQNFLNGFQ